MFRKKRLLASVVTRLGLVLSLGIGASASDLGDAELVSLQALNHVHTGSENVCGGCHTRAETSTWQEYREVDAEDDWHCPDCGGSVGGSGPCWCGCPSSEWENWAFGETVWEWVDVTGTKYKINCGKTEQTVEGHVGLLKSVTEEGYTLSVVVDGNVSLVSSS